MDLFGYEITSQGQVLFVNKLFLLVKEDIIS